MMFADGNGLPLSGGLLIAGLLYSSASVFITGPLIGERMIAQSDWAPRCERSVIQSVVKEIPALQTPIETPDCENVMGAFAGPDGRAMCGAFGFMFENPLARQINEQNERLRRAHKNRIAQAAAGAGSRCACAVNVALGYRIPFAIHAGTLRLVTPPAIKNLDAELVSALSSNICDRQFK